MKKQKIYNKKLTPEEEQEIRDNLRENPITNKEIWTMVLSAVIVWIPVVLIILGLFYGIIWFFFLR